MMSSMHDAKAWRESGLAARFAGRLRAITTENEGFRTRAEQASSATR
jgi:hypothetical protein